LWGPPAARSVWNQAYKDDFIDTVLLQYPARANFLYEKVSEQELSVYQVVDGKQVEQLARDEKTALRAFWTYQLPIEYLPSNEETIINGIFQRVDFDSWE
jgi:hypothetical protein